jgi:hypothetical protein
MTSDQIVTKSSKDVKISKVQDARAVPFIPPYYWSWYDCAFPKGSCSPENSEDKKR